MQPYLRHIPRFIPVKKNDTQDLRIQMAPIYIRKLPTEDKHNSYILVLIAFICCSIGYLLCLFGAGRPPRTNV